MTGTLTSIPLAQQVDVNGHPLTGCRLFLYQANTSTPVISYRNFGLSAGQEHAWPIVADMYGRIPMFWLADGFYRARLEDRFGRVIFDETQMPAIGGGGGGGTVIASDAFKTGDLQFSLGQGVKAGWVRANGKTIGKNDGTEFYGAECASLYSWLYENFDDILCPVTGGRTNAAADFAAGKTIRLYDMRALGIIGADAMGNTTSGRMEGVPGGYINTFPLPAAVGNPAWYDRPGSQMGANMHTLTIGQTPAHAHGSQVNDVGHYHPYYHSLYASQNYYVAGNPAPMFTEDERPNTGENSATNTVTITNAVALTPPHSPAANQPHNNVSATVVGTWYMRL